MQNHGPSSPKMYYANVLGRLLNCFFFFFKYASNTLINIFQKDEAVESHLLELKTNKVMLLLSLYEFLTSREPNYTQHLVLQ